MGRGRHPWDKPVTVLAVQVLSQGLAVCPKGFLLLPVPLPASCGCSPCPFDAPGTVLGGWDSDGSIPALLFGDQPGSRKKGASLFSCCLQVTLNSSQAKGESN